MSDFEFLKNAKVQVPHRSGFDKSHRALFTMPVGTLIPAMCDEIIPNTKIDLSVALDGKLPPLASETYANCRISLQSFFVPTRLLYGGFESWLTGEKVYDDSTQTYVRAEGCRCRVPITSTGATFLKQGTLGDYLGIKLSKADYDFMSAQTDPTKFVNFNPYPFLGYHKIYDDWYRNPLVQSPVFSKPLSTNQNYSISDLPYRASSAITDIYLGNAFRDGVYLGSLRQRNFDVDYFTVAQPSAQFGNAPKLSFSTTGSTGEFTLAALRSVNSLTQFLERCNISGPRYVDYVKAHYGAVLPAGIAQRAVFLGSGSVDIYTKGVNTTSNSDGQVQSISNNPFETVGSQYGQASCNGVVKLVDNFTAMEHGYLFVMLALVPKVTYSNGVDRMMMHYTSNASQSDMATPLLQNVGQQPIYGSELNAATYLSQPSAVFGYSDRYSEFMTKEDRVHGLLRDGYSLQSFALQRTTPQSPNITSNFLAIPTTYLDQIAATTSGISGYGCWCDCYFNYKVAQPLQKYCIPSLQDPAYEHGDTVTLQRGGTSINS